MEFRDVHVSDLDAIYRLWEEAGWARPDSAENHRKMLEAFLAVGHGRVAIHDDAPVAMALTHPAHIRHLDSTLPCAIVAAVNTAQHVRKRGLAARLTAEMLALKASEGIPVTVLGMFDQGFYNKLGYGSGPAMHIAYFDPRSLRREFLCRIPKRFTLDIAAQLHAARMQRLPSHGQLLPDDARIVEADLFENGEGFGLGYFDGPDGTLSHGFWVTTRDAEFGPYDIHMLTYQSPAQFHELLGLMRTFGDQVYTIAVLEPPMVQWQDLLDEPFRRRRIGRGGSHAVEPKQMAWWQIRILDLPAALAATHLPGPSITFQAQITDPIVEVLPDDSPWRGIGGEYVITLGEECSAVPGSRADLPVLKTSINAFSRLWFGCRTAMELEMSDHFVASPSLIAEIDRVWRLPRPDLDWAI